MRRSLKRRSMRADSYWRSLFLKDKFDKITNRATGKNSKLICSHSFFYMLSALLTFFLFSFTSFNTHSYIFAQSPKKTKSLKSKQKIKISKRVSKAKRTKRAKKNKYKRYSQTISKINRKKTQKKESLFEAQWKVLSDNKIQNGDQNTKNRYLLQGASRFQFNFHKSVKLLGEINLNLMSTQAQDQFVQESSNGIILREGLIGLMPFEKMGLYLGAVNQRKLVPTRLFMSKGRAFPGVKLEYCLRLFSGCLSVKAESVIPTSYSLSIDRVEKEAQPQLSVQMIEYKSDEDQDFQVHGYFSLFNYAHLTAVTADKSRLYGNTVDETGKLARFRYDYEGWSTGVWSQVKWNDYWGAMFQSEILQNDMAPFEKSKSQFIGIGLDLYFGNVRVRPEYQNYFIEQDSVVSSYMDGFFGSTNVEGQGGGLSLFFKNQGFKVTALYHEQQPLVYNEKSIFQEKEKIYTLRLETKYADFF